MSKNSDMDAAGDSGNDLPDIKNDGRMYVYLSGNHFQQNKVIIPKTDFNTINIYCVYELQPISSLRDTSFTTQNALFGAMQIAKDPTNNSKNNYKGYGLCFDERSNFSHTITQDGRQGTSSGKNVLIFGADLSSSIHIIVLVKDLRKVLMILQYTLKKTIPEILQNTAKNLC